MGSAPVHTVKADLNGTGVLVDITTYVDEAVGLRHSWGRTDWSTAEPTPGSLSFTLDNTDGRFTPGNTATYTVGLTVGVLVEWITVDTVGAVVPTTIIDEFNRADGYIHGQSAPDGATAATWVSGVSLWSISSTKVKRTAQPGGDSVAYLDTTETDGTITTTLTAIHATTGTRRAGLAFRVVDGDNYYRVRASSSSAVWVIESVVATVATVLYTSAVVPTVGDVVTVELSGASLTASINGVALGSPLTMASHLTATKVGFYGSDTDLTSSWERIAITTGAPGAAVRVRRFRTGVPELTFPQGVASASQVSVTCYDALAVLAKRKARQAVDEQTLLSPAVAHWPISESDTGATARAMDISGHAEPPLAPFGDPALLTWGQGVGPRTDGRAALIINPDATVEPGTEDAGLTLEAPLGSTGSALDWLTDDTVGGTDRIVYGFQMWFSVNGAAYDATSSTAADTDGPYVIIARVGWCFILWRIPDRRIVVGWPGAVSVDSFGTADATASEGAVHHIAVGACYDWPTGASGLQVHVWLDGVYLGSSAATYAFISSSTITMPPEIEIGGSTIASTIDGTGADQSVYGLAGTVAVASIHDATGMTVTSNVPAFVGDITQVYPVGAGVDEDAAGRFERIGSWLGSDDLAFVAQGTAQPVLVGTQNTGGKSLLAAMCDALRFEESSLDVAVLYGVDTVRAWLGSETRPVTAALTVDVDADGVGLPDLAFDSTGAVETVEARGFSRTVTWLNESARWADTSTSVQAASDVISDLTALAQFRALLGRVETLTPARVIVDAVSSVADLTAALLDLRPMVRVAVEGLPSNVIGFDSVDCVLVGVVERHSLGRALWELTLMPDLPYEEGIADSSRASELTFHEPAPDRWFPAIWGSTGGAACTNSQTTVYLIEELSTYPLLGTTADVPMRMIVDSEEMTVTAIAARVDSDPAVSTQALTVTRGANGTTATTHPGFFDPGHAINVEFPEMGDPCATF